MNLTAEREAYLRSSQEATYGPRMKSRQMDAQAMASASDMDPPRPDPTRMRQAMGAFASGVTIITGFDEDQPVGFACQSFASVSLDPPLVLFCADHRGLSWQRIVDNGSFCVNVLGADQIHICDRFGSSRGTKFEGLAWERSRWNTPALPRVLMRAHAEVEAVHKAGDHDIVVGRVLEVEVLDEDRPLLFYRGKLGLPGGETHPAPSTWDVGWG